jgi:methionyl-tRNA formyltransferase
MDGKRETGVCLMQMDEGMDTGDVLACHRTPITPEDNAGTLAERLGRLAAEVTRIEVPRFVRGELAAEPQDHERATHAPPLSHEDAKLSFSWTKEQICNRVRGLAPRPGASTNVLRAGTKAKRLKILEIRVAESGPNLKPGLVGGEGPRLLLGTVDGPLEILSAQIEGKKAQSAADLRNGRALMDGDVLGEADGRPKD